MATLRKTGDKVEVLATLNHQLPVTDFKGGLNTQYALHLNQGNAEGADFGVEVPGGGFIGENFVCDIAFKLISTEEISFTIAKIVDGKTVQTTTGVLRRAEPGSVLRMLSNLAKSFFATYKTAPVAIYPVDLKDLLADNCLTVFQNPCDELERIGFLPSPASRIENQRAEPIPLAQPAPQPPAGTPPITHPTPELNQPRDPRQNQNDLSTPQAEPHAYEPPPVTIDPPGKAGIDERPYPYVLIEDKVNEEALVAGAQVECADPADCPDNVGLLIGSTGREVYQCTANYIGNGLFSTNSHCLPANLGAPGANFTRKCFGTLWVKMPKTKSSGSEVFNCDEVVWATATDENSGARESRDVMIFRVREIVNRAAAVVDWKKAPTAAGQKLGLWVVDPVRGKRGIHGFVRHKTCLTADPRKIQPLLKVLNRGDYPVAHLASCRPQIIKGNSGSAAFDARGTAVAVVSHTGESGSGQGLASNYACLGTEFDDRGAPVAKAQTCSAWIPKDGIDQLREQAASVRRKKSAEEISDVLLWIAEVRKNTDSVKTALGPAHAGKLSADFAAYKTSAALTRFFGPGELMTWPSNLDTRAAMNFTDSYGRRYSLVTMAQAASVGDLLGEMYFHSITLPSCIKAPRLWMEDFRTDRWWQIFSSKSYSEVPVELLVTVGADTLVSLTPLELNPQNYKTVHLTERRTTSLPVDFKIKVVLSGYGEAPDRTPRVEVSFERGGAPVEPPQAKMIREKLAKLPVCGG